MIKFEILCPSNGTFGVIHKHAIDAINEYYILHQAISLHMTPPFRQKSRFIRGGVIQVLGYGTVEKSRIPKNKGGHMEGGGVIWNEMA